MSRYIFVTGAGGFIGNELSKCLLNKYKNFTIIGIDNLNNYYDIKIKKKKIKNLSNNNKFKFAKIDISNYSKMYRLFKKYKPQYVFNLAAQAGVRYSLANPDSYIQSNIIGFYNILKLSKENKVKCLYYA